MRTDTEIPTKGLSEWHAIRQMQDQEYEISARVDEEKQKDKEAKLMRQEVEICTHLNIPTNISIYCSYKRNCWING